MFVHADPRKEDFKHREGHNPMHLRQVDFSCYVNYVEPDQNEIKDAKTFVNTRRIKLLSKAVSGKCNTS